MDSAYPSIAKERSSAPVRSDPTDALASYARKWPDLASALAGDQDIGDGSTYRGMLHLYLDQFLKGQSVAADLASITAAMRSILDHESAEQFKLALTADARTATDERFASGHVQSFWGVTPIINLGTMRSADRRLDIFAESFCYQPYHTTSAFDVVLVKQYEWALKNDVIAYSWLTFVWAMLRYDVFHTYYDRGILLPVGGYGSPNYGINIEEMRLMHLAGKRLYCLAYGADNRTRARTKASGDYNFCMHCTTPGRYCICDDEQAEKMFAVIDQYTTANLASGLSIDYVPNSYELHYLVVDTDAIAPSDLSMDTAKPLLVLHAPNHPHFKGSHYLIDAVRELRAEGVPIELKLVGGVPQTQVEAEMRAADVVADQFIGGFYGQTAIEAMALGRPVMCYIQDTSRAAAPDELPIINCRPDSLKDALRRLVADRDALPALGQMSRRYVERYHSLPALTHRLRKLYDDTAGFPETVKLADAPPPSMTWFELERQNASDSLAMHSARNDMRNGLASLVAASLVQARLAWSEATTERDISARSAAAEAIAKEAQRAALIQEANSLRQAEAAKAEAAQLSTALAATEAALAASEMEKADISARAAPVAAMLRQIQASKAWQISAPIRDLHKLLRGATHKSIPRTGEAPSELATSAQDFLKQFRRARKRPLRVLHIGNAENNAYVNASIQRKWGIDADVLAMDDYSAMASPEWQDVNFRQIIADSDRPDWRSIDRNGFRRPAWFAQGPVDACVRYLLAKTGKLPSASGLRRWLNFERWLLTRRSLASDCVRWLIRSRTNRNVGQNGVSASAILLQYWGSLQLKWSERMKLVPPIARAMERNGKRAFRMGRMAEGQTPTRLTVGDDAGLHIETLSQGRHPYLRILLKRYDVVQCYGEHATLPFAAQHRDYFVYDQDSASGRFAFSQPDKLMFEASRLVATAVFFTGPESLAASAELGFDPERAIALPCAVDSEKLLRFARQVRAPRPGRVVRFVTSAPHGWAENKSTHTNGNDRLLHALAIVRATGRTCRLATIAWGQDVEASKALSRQLGVADMIEWKLAMPTPLLWGEYVKSDAVIDHFGAGNFRGAALDAMLLGRRVISQIDAVHSEQFFGALPPTYFCKTPEDIARAMIRVIDDPADLAMDGAKNQTWAAHYQSSERVLALQVNAYRRLGGLNVPPKAPKQGLLHKLAAGPLRPIRPMAAPLYRFVRKLPSRTVRLFRIIGGGPRAWKNNAKAIKVCLRRHAYAVWLALFTWGGKAAMRMAIPLGRMLTRRRMRTGKTRTLWGITPILTLPLLARCDRMLGLHSDSLVYTTYYTSKNFDINLSKSLAKYSNDGYAHVAFTYWVMASALLRFDVFNFFYDRGVLLPPNGRMWIAPEELKALKAAGKRIYTYAYGADVRTRETTLALGQYNFCVDCPSPRKFCLCDEGEAKRNIDGIRAHANAMIAMADMIHYVPGCRNFHYWPLDLDKIPYVGSKWRGGRPLQILHAPNHMHFKGSRHLVAAVDRLRAEGVAVELKTISGVSNVEVLKAMAETDIVAEQFIGGAFGYTAAEAWAMGKPVLTYVRDPSVTPSWEDFPALSANPDALYDTIKRLAAGEFDLPAMGLTSRRYAEAYYSLEAVAINLGKLYLETGSFEPKTAGIIKANLETMRAKLATRLARPLIASGDS